MLTLGEKVRKIRSKNAGPFWITIDIFCGNKKIYKEVCIKLTNSEIINLFMINEQQLKRFEIDNLNVIKFSFPRKIIMYKILNIQFVKKNMDKIKFIKRGNS